MDDDTREPPVPPGLGKLIDDDLLAAAAAASPRLEDDSPALRAWVRALSARAKEEWLVRAVQEPAMALGAELRHEFRRTLKPAPRAKSEGRLVAELREAAVARASRARPRSKRTNEGG